MAESQPAVNVGRHRGFQFALRSLVLRVLVTSVGMSWLAARVERTRKEEKAVEGLRALGATVIYDYECPNPEPGVRVPPGPAWLRRLLGEHFFARVYVVSLGSSVDGATGSSIDDGAFKHLKTLTDLPCLHLGAER